MRRASNHLPGTNAAPYIVACVAAHDADYARSLEAVFDGWEWRRGAGDL
eukprot:COSAG02_NODE_70859_length_193_cov_64.914894_1_plen_48_part_01